MAVYFKFGSLSHSNFDTIPLDSSNGFISVGELKQSIMKKKKLDKNTGLVLTNAQTNEGLILLSCVPVSRNSNTINYPTSDIPSERYCLMDRMIVIVIIIIILILVDVPSY